MQIAPHTIAMIDVNRITALPPSSHGPDMKFWSRAIAWWKAVTICPEKLVPMIWGVVP